MELLQILTFLLYLQIRFSVGSVEHIFSLPDSPTLTFSAEWQVLGPFQIGTREASWGADPLEIYGGFRSLSFNIDSQFRSSLANNGTTTWLTFATASVNERVDQLRVSSHIGFSNVDWYFLQSVYGWASLQYQAWARGVLYVNSRNRESIRLNIKNVLELWIDDENYFGGDYYGYERAPMMLLLNPGPHRIDVRLIYDVRLMGGFGNPTIPLILESAISTSDLFIASDHLLAPDIVNDTLASHFASVPLRNESPEWITIMDIESSRASTQMSLLQRTPVRLAPGQSRPLAFDIYFNDTHENSIVFQIVYFKGSSRVISRSVPVVHRLHSCSRLEPHRFTYLHPSGIVSYGILRAPNDELFCSQNKSLSLPVMLSLHGAGVEVANREFSHVFDGLPEICAWLIMPSAVTTWSGDDWHDWGLADAEAAVDALSLWISSVGWNGPRVDASKWIVNGHSNGGQGTWHVITHRPDKVIAAAPLSGYTSIENYVPYHFWHITDPRLMALVFSALSSHKHERLLANIKGIPIMQQHGDHDENVPAYHSRYMRQLLDEYFWTSTYIELPKMGHWFEGIMTTPSLKEFYHNSLRIPQRQHLRGNFSVIVANPGDMGSNHGFQVEQLQTPGRYGRMGVEVNAMEHILFVCTDNIRRFKINREVLELTDFDLILDDQRVKFDTKPFKGERKSALWFLKKENGSWMASNSPNWASMERSPSQMGALTAILRTKERFRIDFHNLLTFKVGLQISRNLFQYFGADAEIGSFYSNDLAEKGNLVRVETGVDKFSVSEDFPLRLKKGRYLSIAFEENEKTYHLEEGMGAIFLKPLQDGRLELVVWGFDEDGLRRAARLFPILTGVGQPDFILLGRECSFKGLDGVLAMGFFNNSWKVSFESYFR